jgi:hypothetical protein
MSGIHRASSEFSPKTSSVISLMPHYGIFWSVQHSKLCFKLAVVLTVLLPCHGNNSTIPTMIFHFVPSIQNIMSIFSSALLLAALLVAPSDAAVNFCGPTAAACFFNHSFTDLGANLNITVNIGGVSGKIINDGGSVDFYAKGIGFLDEICYNNGVWDAPGQNKNVTTEGAQETELNAADNGSIETFITTDSDCDCGLDEGSYYNKKEKKTYVCPADAAVGTGEVGAECCLAADPNDLPVTCPSGLYSVPTFCCALIQYGQRS